MRPSRARASSRAPRCSCSRPCWRSPDRCARRRRRRPPSPPAFGAATIQVGRHDQAVVQDSKTTPLVPTVSWPLPTRCPPGLVVATPPGVVNSCGGIVSANAGSNLFQISGVRCRSAFVLHGFGQRDRCQRGREEQYNHSSDRPRLVEDLAASIAITVFAPSTSVASVSPTSGTTSGGTRITITGTNLASATAVTDWRRGGEELRDRQFQHHHRDHACPRGR